MHSVVTAVSLFKVNKAKNQLNQLTKQVLKAILQSDQALLETFEGEIKSLQVRAGAMELIVEAGDEETIKEFAARFLRPVGRGPADELPEGDAQRVASGQSPPCPLYAQLQPARTCPCTPRSTCRLCAKPAHLKQVHEKIAWLKGPVAQLLAQAANAERCLRAAQEQRKRCVEKLGLE